MPEQVLIDTSIIVTVVTALCGVIVTLFWLLIKSHQARVADKDKCYDRSDAGFEKVANSLEKIAALGRAYIDSMK